MRVVFVSFFYDESLESEEHLIQKFYTTTCWAEAMQSHGVEVVVLQRFKTNNSFKRNGVQYHFTRDFFRGRLKRGQVPLKFILEACRSNADVLHTSSTLFTPLLRMLCRKQTAIVVQHHGGAKPGRVRGFFYAMADSFADALFFTTKQQGEAWFGNKKLSDKIMPVMEGSTRFRQVDRETARKKTGLSGNPLFIWVGNLNENKDPLTVLTGFDELFMRYPEARLVMIYGGGSLLPLVTEKINGSNRLRRNTLLKGKIPHTEMEMYFNSADYFVLGSHYEGSGYALCEALACGCIPVVTSIPSFRMMTDNGRLGALWETGNQKSFIDALDTAMNKPPAQESKACADFFNMHLSFKVITKIAIAHYNKARLSRGR